MSIQIENTDTFGGEANYCWANRWFTKAELTDRQVVVLAKKLSGFTGYKCRKEEYGDTLALYPAGFCQVVFVSWADDGHEQGKEVDKDGNLIEKPADE